LPLDVAMILGSLDDCFRQGGLADFDQFLADHLTARKWIIASDFNIGAEGAAHDVFAFACFPVEQGFTKLIDRLGTTFPADFKRSKRIAQDQISFFGKNLCFCFVFLIPRPWKMLRTGNHSDDLAQARQLIEVALEEASKRHHDSQVSHLRSLYKDSKKNNFSLSLFEQIILLCSFHAFVSGKIAFRSPVDQIGWFPDRDKMTTYCRSAWSGLSFMMFEGYWREAYGARQLPLVGIPDHQRTDLLVDYDPLIRVPDFIAATFSRWDIEERKVSRPSGARKEAMPRYLKLITGWTPEKSKMWICRVRVNPETVSTGRLITARTKRRLRRYDLT
jgi:hypothetical protein